MLVILAHMRHMIGGEGSEYLHLFFLLGEVLELDQVDDGGLQGDHVVGTVGVGRLFSLIK
jgi:hypothetical protein